MENFRIGFGYDSHRFTGAKPLRLGGVTIPGAPGLRGHSDGDALVHALIDALLGAAALGDIGERFPDSDPAWQDAASAMLLDRVVREVSDAGWRVGNVDATIICERPRLRAYASDIRASLAERLHIPMDSVSVKGKTNEGMDSTGQGVGLAVHCVALLVRR